MSFWKKLFGIKESPNVDVTKANEFDRIDEALIEGIWVICGTQKFQMTSSEARSSYKNTNPDWSGREEIDVANTDKAEECMGEISGLYLKGRKDGIAIVQKRAGQGHVFFYVTFVRGQSSNRVVFLQAPIPFKRVIPPALKPIDTQKSPAPTPEDATLLLEAAKEGDLEKVKAMLDQYPDLVLSKDQYGRTPLHRAAEYDRKDVAQLLLANKAAIDIRATGGIFLSATPLHIAASTGSKQVLEVLLTNKADVNAKMGGTHFSGSTPLSLAAMKDYKEIMQLLRQHGGRE